MQKQKFSYFNEYNTYYLSIHKYINKHITNVGQCDVDLSQLALPCSRILLVQGWGLLPTL